MSLGLGLGLGLGLSRARGGRAKSAIFTFTSRGTGADTGTLSLFYPASEGGKIVKATGNVKLGEGGNLTEQVIIGGAINTFIVTCSSGMGTLVLPNTYTRFSANTSDTSSTNGWVTSANSPSLAFDIATFPTGLITFNCTGSNTVNGKLPVDWKSMRYFDCRDYNTIGGNLPADWKSMRRFSCTGYYNTIGGNLPADWKSMVHFFCSGYNTISGITDGKYAGNGNMSYLLLNSDNSLGGLSTGDQESLLINKATRTWAGYLIFNLATSASMADTAIGGRWFDENEDPTDVAVALKTLVKVKGVTVTLKDLTMPDDESGDGGGFPAGFGDWWRSP